ncbi:HD domain-containing protein [Ectobacillus antri]|uniref:HD domain-containing protein n=1 Tax=Ectobacillus antri TaxID=2486280 RepID=A0ABT6H0J4_9BACI|nr:HD domain-containing protein [Ectobacillus antri]MDG4655747.1 HD domain-containing protein [Ectobacillus antri]MDG5752422.1 HD domain-containing protein [Ectobacillus antri]
MRQTFKQAFIYEPLYRYEVTALPHELELFQSKTLRRLKFLTHYGTASLFSSIMHSRLDHTVGVWSIIARFFPQEQELRLAALLHDIGHLPFSHAVEKTLGFNHHQNTEKLIEEGEIAGTLRKYGFKPTSITTLLNQNTPLTNTTSYLGADHFDSFLRDAYFEGGTVHNPYELVNKIHFNGNVIETDVETGLHIMDAMVVDHTSFLSPYALAIDGLLAKAIEAYSEFHSVNISFIEPLTNYELIYHLQTSESPLVKELIKIILWEPYRISVSEEIKKEALQVEVKKIYDKEVLVDGKPITLVSQVAREKLQQIRDLQKTYYVTYEK